jgi:hypothetical protein
MFIDGSSLVNVHSNKCILFIYYRVNKINSSSLNCLFRKCRNYIKYIKYTNILEYIKISINMFNVQCNLYIRKKIVNVTSQKSF